MCAVSSAALSGALPSRAADQLPLPAQDLAAPAEGETSRTAVFAGGCFWCTEAVCEAVEGVTEVVSGYAGGGKDDANYKMVSRSLTNHAEAIKVTYDPRKTSYGRLLRIFFATTYPTQRDGSGPDHGRHYRSAIFYENDDQKRVAEAYIKQLTDAKVFDRPIVTTLEPLAAGGFHPAEDYHQDYVANNPTHPYIVQWALPKLDKLRSQFGDELKKPGPATQP